MIPTKFSESAILSAIKNRDIIQIRLMSVLLSIVSFWSLSFHPAQAQDSFLNRFDIGGALTNSVMNYESYGENLNENLSHDFGYKFHLHYNHPISEKVTLLTGLEYVFFTYTFEDYSITNLDENGEPIESYTKLSMTDEFHTTHLALPVRVKYHPLPEYRVYITAGTELYYKTGFSNGKVENQSFSENGEPQSRPYFTEYSIPETANDFVANGTAGLGYSFNPYFPLTFEMRFSQSLTPYRSGKGIVNSYIQEFTFSFSYRL